MASTTRSGDTLSKAASIFTEGVSKTKSIATGHAIENKKVADLQRDTVDVLSGPPMTVDFGHKISNTDHWLKVASDRKTGPQLLEDHVAREKVGASIPPKSDKRRVLTSTDSPLRPRANPRTCGSCSWGCSIWKVYTLRQRRGRHVRRRPHRHLSRNPGLLAILNSPRQPW